jgi:hypothetical protein
MNSARMDGATNAEATGAGRSYDYQTPAYAATLALTVKQGKAVTLVKPGTLTGNMTINVGVGSATTDPQIGDELKIIMKSDGSIRTVTFGTGFQPTAATIVTVANKTVSACFMFDGTGWQEMSRAIQA